MHMLNLAARRNSLQNESNNLRNRKANRQPVCEPLEQRQLMSLTIALREADGGSSATVSSVGQVLNLDLVATITSANGIASQDSLQDVNGNMISSAATAHSVAGNLAATNVAPFTGAGAAPGTQQDLNGDGNIDVGGDNPNNSVGEFFARSTNPEGSTVGTTVGNSLEFVIAHVAYTVTHLNGGGATDINFVIVPTSLPQNAAWSEELKPLNNLTGTFQAGAPFVVSDPALITPLKGTAIGTAGSYHNSGNTIANVFDGNLSTYFDAPAANGDWVGLDLKSQYNITQINFAPRSGWAGRMIGGVFQGSNDPTFTTGVVPLAVISTAPANGLYTSVEVTVPATFRYVRYLAPTGSYGNVAEIQFVGYPATTAISPLTGTVIGTAGSWQNDGDTIANAFDGNLSTFFDGPVGNGDWTGLDLGAAKTISAISFAPRVNWAQRMVGGIFQASNSANFSTGVVNLYTITTPPAANTLTTVNVNVTGSYRYVRYLSPTGGYGNVAEVEFYGS
jgi:hypothetical protein